MGLLRRTFGLERRGTLANPQDWMKDALGGGATYSGKRVSAKSALGLVAVYRAVTLLSGAVGSLPLFVYRRVEGGRERADNHPMWRLCTEQPNPEMAADEVWETVMAHLLLWGNAFLAKVRDPAFGTVAELWPISPSRVQVGRDTAGQRFFVVDGEGRHTELDILHIRGPSMDGLVGLSPVQECRQALGSSMALEEFEGAFWANGTNLGGVLQHPNKLSPEAAQRLAASWAARFSGPSAAGKTPVLEEGLEFKPMGMPLKDAQFVEASKLGDVRVAQMFGLPASFLDAPSGDSLTYATTESQGRHFVTYSLRRWLTRIENSLLRDPSLFVQGRRFYPEFLTDALLSANTKDRYEAYAIALDPQKGWMDRGEVRERENLNPEDEDEPAPPPPSNGLPDSPEASLAASLDDDTP